MTVQTNTQVAFRFGDCEFIVRDLELRRHGTVVPLARKPALLLALLLEHRDRIVLREEISAALWPDVRVSGAAFHSVVRDLRRAIGDKGRRATLIATTRWRGLRFVGQVDAWALDRDEATRGGDAYVGRHGLIARMRALLESALAGAGHVVLLEGPAGVGKTRTAREIARIGRSIGVAPHFGRCWRPGFAPPYRPWVEIMRSILARAEPETRSALLGGENSPLSRLVDAVATQPAISATGEHQARFEILDSIGKLIERASEAAPLVVLLDDLEDGDAETLDALESVAIRIENARVVLVGIYRSEAIDTERPLLQTITRLSRLPHTERCAIDNFDEGETREFVDALVDASPSAAQIGAMQAQTDGNPLLLSLLVRSGNDASGRFAWSSASTPSLIREWLRGTLLELPHPCVDVLESAATVGRVFDVETITRVLDFDLPDVERALAIAVRAGLLKALRPPIHAFSHALIQEAIYNDIPYARRVEMHARTGEAIAALHGDELMASAARHLVLAVELVGDRAVDAAERAAEFAQLQLAFDEAVRLRELALQALGATPHPSAARRCDLMIALARSQFSARRVDAAQATARRAIDAAREAGNAEQFAQAALLLPDSAITNSREIVGLLEEALSTLPADPSKLAAELSCALSVALWYQRQPERRLSLALNARAAAESLGHSKLEIRALLAERHALHAPEHLPERVALCSRAVALAERDAHEAHRCLALSWRAVDLLESGAIVSAQLDVDAVARAVEEQRGSRLVSFPERWSAMRASLAGRFDEAVSHVGAAHELMLRARDPSADAYFGIQTGLILHEQGRQDDLAKLIESSPWLFEFREHIPSVGAAIALIELEAGSPGPARDLLGQILLGGRIGLWRDPEVLGTASWLAEICTRLGDAEVASTLLEWLSPHGERISCSYSLVCRGALAHYLGLLARTADRLDESVLWLEKAIVVNRAIGADHYRAFSEWELAQTLARRGAPRDDVHSRALAARAKGSGVEPGRSRRAEATHSQQTKGTS